jgi:hypothetical protein
METPHQVGKRWLKRTFVLVAMMFAIQGVFALARPNPVNHLAKAVVLLLTMPLVFGLPAYCLGNAVARLRRRTVARGQPLGSAAGVVDELAIAQDPPPSLPTALGTPRDIHAVPPPSRSARWLRTSALLLSAVIIAALASVAVLAMNDRALLIWIDSAAELKARGDRDRLKAAFDRLDDPSQDAERDRAASECRTELRSSIYDREMFCVASDELVLQRWALKEGLSSLDVSPCIYLLGAQTFSRPRAGVDQLCPTLVHVSHDE